MMSMERDSRKARSGSRRRSREITLSLLYSLEFASKDRADEKTEDTFDIIERNESDDEYARRLFEGVCRNLGVIDERIRSYSHHWRLERMNLIDRNILRIGVFELVEGLVPVEVAINEAVELSKVFGDSKSSSFVNGILDAIARQEKEKEEEKANAEENN